MTSKYEDLRGAIKELGMTHNELASLLGISWSGLQDRIRRDRLDLHLTIRGLYCIKGNSKTDKWKERVNL